MSTVASTARPALARKMRPFLLLVLLGGFPVLAAGQQASPAFVDRLESAPLPPTPPDEDPSRWLLAFADVETTGLAPFYHEMIDVGLVITDLAGNERDRLFLRIQPEHPERTSEGARAVNAFDEARWRELGASPPAEAVERISAFVRGASENHSVLLVAFNSQFDTAFLDALFRGAGRSWRELFHYFVLDVPSMAWSLGLRGLDGPSLAEALGVEDEPHQAEDHTGITGAALNARIYRALLARRAREE